MRHISVVERRSRLTSRQLLTPSTPSPVDVAAAMVGLHSSDPATVYLSLQARLAGFTRGDLEQHLYEDRTLLRLLGMRRTMFVVDPEVAAVMTAACTRALVGAEQRRLAKLIEDQGIARDGAAWVAGVCDDTMAALTARREAVATELRQDVPELQLKLIFGAGKKWAGEVGVSTRILFLLATEGRIIRARPRGSWLSSQYRWAPTEQWAGAPLPELETAEAQQQLVARWLRTFGPGTLTDIKWWTGWTVGATRAALAAVGAVEVSIDDTDGATSAYVLAEDQATADEGSAAALLPGLDPTPMGWKQRNWFLGGHDAELFDRNGNIGPTVWSEGRIVGGWGQDPEGAVQVQLLEKVSSGAAEEIEAARGRLQEWLGNDIVSPRFPTPLQKRIAGR